MRIFVGGMARSGSTWAFNITRTVLRLSGKTPIPEEQEQSEAVHIQQAAKVPAGPNEVYCIKTHQGFEPTSDDIKLICNYRDVRSAGLSFMRFMNCDFEQTLKAVKEMMDITDFYFRVFKPENALYVRYDDVIEAPQQVIHQVAHFLQVDLPDPVLAYINQKYSKENVAKLLNTMDDVPLVGKNPQEVTSNARFEPRFFSNGKGGAYDRRTSFHAGHITSAKEDEWREAFTADQQTQLNDLSADWLERYHFTL